ncbi:hypothetical protein [Desertihabitans aurantiacus]|uniref:hypothetical protein n=1 Tax=Desertihabitans aurantiacus TaxID=2282477 RepID=UPI0013009AD8|nr:hypothetical protein [Desertihabitans aurantiacus]
MLTSGGSDLGGYPLLLVLGVGTVVLLLVVLIWVVLGCFEHTLRVLVAVADHTREP